MSEQAYIEQFLRLFTEMVAELKTIAGELRELNQSTTAIEEIEQ